MSPLPIMRSAAPPKKNCRKSVPALKNNENLDLRKRTEILGQTAVHRDIKTGFRGHIEKIPGVVGFVRALSAEFHATRAGDDVHPLGRVGVEVIFPCPNQSRGFFRSVGEQDRMAHNAAVEIDVGFQFN